uniref:Uncharacterized protein n=1 Tax=Anguilla anguilla TaxID=7936 RepID=A0A0E9WCU9_ANGAN
MKLKKLKKNGQKFQKNGQCQVIFQNPSLFHEFQMNYLQWLSVKQSNSIQLNLTILLKVMLTVQNKG